MSPRPLQAEFLDSANAVLDSTIKLIGGDAQETRMQLLEACAARFGGFQLDVFQSAFNITSLIGPRSLTELADPIASAIETSGIHPSLALSALASESLGESERRSTGSYHTDFRLARRLSELAAPHLTHFSKVVDPACGAGILLVALSIAVCGRDRAKLSVWLRNGVSAADLSSYSLRGALTALASLTDDVSVLIEMRGRWQCGDSLMLEKHVWLEMAPNGFDCVIGNPPWEKIKLSRHEYIRSTGNDRHYGAATENLDESDYQARRDDVTRYSRLLLSRYPDLGNGEPDLYIAFTALFFELCRPSGVVSAFLPGGLLRSQGTHSVRRKIIESSSLATISIFDNRARFFAIDTRFKFLAIALVKSASDAINSIPITLVHERGTPYGVEEIGRASISRNILKRIRKDLSIPEVKSQAEWKLFQKASNSGCSWDDPDFKWRPQFCREVDMTKERPHFSRKCGDNLQPLIEGRMIHNHRFGAKGYSMGTGRKAIWQAYSIGSSRINPQFWVDICNVPLANRDRTRKLRVGFCDIAGQTNERSLMAALIPEGVICGNKVPTLLFPDDMSIDRLLVWTAIANSFVFDWLLRRILTTTVNYFLLQSVPLPRIAKDGLPWRRLAMCAAELRNLDSTASDCSAYSRISQLRSEIDAEVAIAYGVGVSDFEMIFTDFPLIDRGQPTLSAEPKSTITRDTALAMLERRIGLNGGYWSDRVRSAEAIGALAYVPSEVAAFTTNLNGNSGEKLNA